MENRTRFKYEKDNDHISGSDCFNGRVRETKRSGFNPGSSPYCGACSCSSTGTK